MPELITVTAVAIKETEGPYKGFQRTEIYRDGILIGCFLPHEVQPKRSATEIVVKGVQYRLKWQNQKQH
ncbi:hypothetical protein PV783_33955 [Chitinophaga sp. CC14]|uniref:hypothetical protein n=1 Tax=Chitinophaga sp. CC14 TaxID=3029199 RepID=UPI003B78FC00